MPAGERVLLIGGSGFIGSRLAEKLSVDEGARLRVFMRDAKTAAMVGRYPIEMHIAPLSDLPALHEAAAGCSVIYHLAHDVGHADSASINLAAAKNVAEAAKTSGARLVYVSSAEVYGDGYFGDGGRTLDETAPKKTTAHRAYAASKLAVERYLEGEASASELDVVILEPTVVYGPYSKPWVHRPIELLKTGWVLLPRNGAGTMNHVFVDDVVQALLKAGDTPGASGRSFLISGPAPATWGQFYHRLESMLERTAVTYAVSKKEFDRAWWSATKRATVDLFSALSDQEVLVRAERIPFVERGFDVARQRLPQLWRSLKQTRDVPASVPEAPAAVEPSARMHLPDPHQRALYESDVTVSSARAASVLGYQPRFDFEQGMQVVEDYARWAYLL